MAASAPKLSATLREEKGKGAARRTRRGIWQVRFETPRTWRDRQGEDGQRGLFDGFFGIFDV